MKVNFIKIRGGGLIASTDEDAELMTKFKNGEIYEVELKLTRNPKFLKKMMAFFKFCFEFYDSGELLPHCTPQQQFNRFRKDLTILAGFYNQTVRLNGDIRIEAQSLAYSNMTEEEFSECYHAVIQAAITHIFKDADEMTINKLYLFF